MPLCVCVYVAVYLLIILSLLLLLLLLCLCHWLLSNCLIHTYHFESIISIGGRVFISLQRTEQNSHIFFVVLKLFRWHSTARSFIWSHALTVSPGLKHLLISLFVVSHIECANTNRKKARASRYLQAHSFTTLQKKTKEVCYLRRELNWMRLSFEIVASTFYSIDTLSVSIFYASLFWNEWVCVLEAAIQFRETSMKLLTAPFIFTSICRHRQIGINWFCNRNTWCWSCCCCYF